MLVAPLHPPNCALQRKRKLTDGNFESEVINLCLEGAQSTIALPVSSGDFSVVRFHQTTANVAGYGYLPFDVLLNISYSMPNRMTWACTTRNKGQERSNFISQNYTIGHGAEEVWGVGNTNLIVGRLGGEPVSGRSVAIVRKLEATTGHALIRMNPENCDSPFRRDSLYATVGHDTSILARNMAAHNKNFMLTTFFIAGRYDESANSLPFNTDIALPTTVDALYADSYALPITAGTVIAFPINTIITARHGTTTFCIRIARLEHESNIKDATSATVIKDTTNYAPTKGVQDYSLTWQVDSVSLQAASGRFTIHHKHRGSSPTLGGYRLATIWGVGNTTGNTEMFAFQKSIREAVYSDSISNSAGWKPTDQPWSGKPSASWDGKTAIGQSTWTAQVTIGSGVNLKVVRTDVYQPYTSDSNYQQATAPLHIPPFYIKDFSRLSNGVDTLTVKFPGLNGGTGFKGQPMQVEAVELADIFQPHRTTATTITYGWRTSEWSTCSVTVGTHTHTHACAPQTAR